MISPDRTYDRVRFHRGSRGFAAFVTGLNGAILLGLALFVTPTLGLDQPASSWFVILAGGAGIGHLVAVVGLIRGRAWSGALVGYLAAAGIAVAGFGTPRGRHGAGHLRRAAGQRGRVLRLDDRFVARGHPVRAQGLHLHPTGPASGPAPRRATRAGRPSADRPAQGPPAGAPPAGCPPGSPGPTAADPADRPPDAAALPAARTERLTGPRLAARSAIPTGASPPRPWRTGGFRCGSVRHLAYPGHDVRPVSGGHVGAQDGGHGYPRDGHPRDQRLRPAGARRSEPPRRRAAGSRSTARRPPLTLRRPPGGQRHPAGDPAPTSPYTSLDDRRADAVRPRRRHALLRGAGRAVLRRGRG